MGGKLSWQAWFGIGLMLISGSLYGVHYFIFRDAPHLFFSFLDNLAFVPIQILLVTLVFQQLLDANKKAELKEKLNMLIGVFFSEVGNELVNIFARIGKGKAPGADLNPGTGELEEIKALLVAKRDFLVRLLENPNLIEHETFTGLLRAVFHIMEELNSRRELKDLPREDYDHLGGDVRRARPLLLEEWSSYMKYLNANYPFLYALSIRTNPFEKEF